MDKQQIEDNKELILRSGVASETMRSIEVMLRDVTDVAIAQYTKTFRPVGKKEAVIGRLQSEETRKLFVLAYRMDKLEDKATAAMELADSEEEREKLHSEAHRYGVYHRLLMELRWVQAQEDLGGYWEHDLGLREGWNVVRMPEQKQHPAQSLIEAIIQQG